MFKGSGKGTKSRGNPIAKEKRLLCHICSSPEHFAHKCPHAAGKGGIKSSSGSSFLAELAAASNHTSASAPQATVRSFFSDLDDHSRESGHSYIVYVDGRGEKLGYADLPELQSTAEGV